MFTFARINPEPLGFYDFYEPLTFAAVPSVMIPAAANSMVSLFASIMPNLEMPQIFPEKFGLDVQAMGLQYLGLIIGSVIGEQVGGFMSDRWMRLREKKTGRAPAPEYRLWLSYAGHFLATIGIVVFTVMIEKADSWSVVPVVGSGIAAAGNQIVTTINIAYVVDRHRDDATSVGVLITFVRQVWGFIGPFWLPRMLENVGSYRSAGIEVALIVGVSIIPTVVLQWTGPRLR